MRGSPDPAQFATEGLPILGFLRPLSFLAARRPAVELGAGSRDPRTTWADPRTADLAFSLVYFSAAIGFGVKSPASKRDRHLRMASVRSG